MSRWQLSDPGEKSVSVIGPISVCQIVVQLPEVRLGDLADRQDARDFTRKDDFVIALEVYEGLDTETVPGRKQAAPPNIPDRKCPHSVETLDTGIAPLRIGMEDHLTVCTRMELVSCGAK